MDGFESLSFKKSRYVQTTLDVAFFTKQAPLLAVGHLTADKKNTNVEP
jgi:hypothetical protein